MKKNISILGSTGSIGLSSLNIINKKKNFFTIYLLASNKNYNSICNQIKKYKPKYFVINDFKIYNRVKQKYKNKKIKILNNFESLTLIKKSDITISAIPGIAGLIPTISMIKKSKKILIANKESIICGWNLIKKNLKKYNTDVIPIDSEHFSIMNLLKNHKLNEIKKIYLTASGGPFLNYNVSQLKNVRPHHATRHPKWKMGKKISVDSSTMMNKILELIEAQKLFAIPENKLDIIIHPNSLVHAIVELKNGLTKFIYHPTSMIVPLANAIFDEKINIDEFYKNKKNNALAEKLIFKKVDKKIFPIIKIKKRANEYSSTSIILNAVNEILVDQFLRKKIPFSSISKIIMTILKDRNYKNYAIKKPKNIKDINIIDMWARNCILNKLGNNV